MLRMYARPIIARAVCARVFVSIRSIAQSDWLSVISACVSHPNECGGRTMVIVAKTKAGAQGRYEKVNQDAAAASEHAVCLCDGHGEFGEIVASIVAKALAENLQGRESHKSAARAAQRSVQSKMGRQGAYSGCAAVWALVDKAEKVVSVANVGDSRCIVLDDGCNLLVETKDHKPGSAGESLRLLQAGGQVITRPGDVPRIAGLALSRAFGDFAATRSGVIADPDTYEVAFDHNPRWIILASDGVFDVMSTDELVAILSSCIDTQEPAKLQEVATKIVELCSERWELETDAQYRDDITLVLWRLDSEDLIYQSRL